MKKISIVVPCFNESAGILLFVEQMCAFVQSMAKYKFEVVFVDDGSSDDTFGILSDAVGDYEWMTVIRFTRNFGKEAALTAGLDFATGDAVVFMDADLQHPLSIVTKFIDQWELGAAVVVGKRVSRDTDSLLYRLLASTFYRLVNKISDVEMPDGAGDFRLIDIKVVGQIRKLKENRRFMKGLFAWVGYSPVWVEYAVEPRASGRSSFNKWKSWNFALEGITSFSTVPLRIWSYLGAIVLFLGLVYAGFIIFNAIVNGIATPGYVTLLTAIVVFGGVQLIGIGVLGEYVGRIYMEVKQRPSYLVAEIRGSH